MTNPSTAQARALIDGLLRSGIADVVLAPGSRNGALSIALAQAARANRIRLQVRVDERSASFLALGIARCLNAPVAVVCTSGTAVAHFHAAAFEATEAGVPLLLLTADRPATMRGKGANQTVDQRDVFGHAVLKSFDAAVAAEQPASHWRGLIADAVAVARGNASTAPGAVHVNLPFAEPLVPGDADASWTETLPESAISRPLPDLARGSWAKVWPAGGKTPRGVIVTSDPLQAADVVAFAEALQWPVLAEPGSGARLGQTAVRRYLDVLLEESLKPDVVVTVGRFALSRAVAAFVRSAPRHVAVGRSPVDPLSTVDVQIPRLPDVSKLAPSDPDWLAAWRAADDAAQHHELRSSAHFVATALASVQPGELVWYGPSSTIRDAERVAPAFDDAVTSFMNRGANGIDGVVSSAVGAAIAHGSHALAVMGDLTFLHDINGLLIPNGSTVPSITFVVVDSNGGRIFRTLEQGASEYADVFEQAYGTPHNRDIAAVAAAYGATAVTVETHDELERALEIARGGVHVIVVNDRE